MRILIGTILAAVILGGSISEASARSLEEKRAIAICRNWTTEMSMYAEDTMTSVMRTDEQYHSDGALTHYQATVVYASVQNYIDQANFKMRHLMNWSPNAYECEKAAKHFIQLIYKTARAGVCGFEPRYCNRPRNRQ